RCAAKGAARHSDGDHRAEPGCDQGAGNDLSDLTRQREGCPHYSTVGRVRLDPGRPEDATSQVYRKEQVRIRFGRSETGAGQPLWRGSEDSRWPDGPITY